jgi:hypothetical protein
VLFYAPEQSSPCPHGGDCEGAGLTALNKKEMLELSCARLGAAKMLRARPARKIYNFKTEDVSKVIFIGP